MEAMDAATLTQQLAKQADTGTAAIILLLVVLCVICWPHVVSGISRLRGKKTVAVEGDVHTAEREQYVPRSEFNKHVEQNDAAHTEIFRRLKETEQKTEHQNGKLDVIGSDVKTIKDILIGKALKK